MDGWCDNEPCEAHSYARVPIPNDPDGRGYRDYCYACLDVFLVGVAVGREIGVEPVEYRVLGGGDDDEVEEPGT